MESERAERARLESKLNELESKFATQDDSRDDLKLVEEYSQMKKLRQV